MRGFQASESKRCLRIIAVTAVMLCAIWPAVPVSADIPTPKWEQVSLDRDAIRDPSDSERVDVSVRDGYIYITTARSIEIKVFTILGQPVAQRKVQPGTVRLFLPAKGIYILKAGDITRRLNI